jgi:acyl-CoA synthetase (NDP forming)
MDFDELIDATKALSYQRPSKGNRVCIITNGGGSGVLAADECMRQGLEVAKLPDDKAEKLRHVFPYFYGINNPIDLTAQVRDEDYITALNELRDDYDGFVIIALPNVMGITEGLAGMIKRVMTDINKPVVFHIPANGVAGRIISLLEKMKIPVYPSPERAVKGLKAILK